jgi:hypothetical protein
MPSITSSNVATAIVKLVAADALPALVGNLIMGNLVNRDYEPTLAQAGDTVNVPIPPTMVANNIAEGGAVNPQNPNIGNAQIVLNTHVEATFLIPDVTKVLAVPDLLRVYMQPAVIAIAERSSPISSGYMQVSRPTRQLERQQRRLPKRSSIVLKRRYFPLWFLPASPSTLLSTVTRTPKCDRLHDSASFKLLVKRAFAP